MRGNYSQFPVKPSAQRTFVGGIDTVLTVDTTIGFRDNGEFIDKHGNKFFYTERTVNQFLGVTAENPGTVIAIGEDVIDDIFVSGTDLDGKVIKVTSNWHLDGHLTFPESWYSLHHPW